MGAMDRRLITILAILGLVRLCGAAESSGRYLDHVKPILRARCYACHGALKQKAGLRLDTVGSMLGGGDSGPVIRPGKASESVLLARVTSEDEEERMPPAHEGERLSSDEVEQIRLWIGDGARAPADERPELGPREHWAFRPIVRPMVPPVSTDRRARNPIDAFLMREQERKGLRPREDASRITLLRRLHLDLTGIPPTPEEITAFRNNASHEFYEQVVDRLLADPGHGERWARHWMDIWRYSEGWGLGQVRRSQKHIWHWRDWIIGSVIADTPYDEMLRLMLAADEIHPDDLDKLRATGFLVRNYYTFNRNKWMEETVEHVSKGFLGLTMNCAKCHDHKYDPIEQVDFYRMRAFFEPYHVRNDILPGDADLERDGIPRVFDGVLDAPTFVLVRGQENHPDKSRVIPPGVPTIFDFDGLEVSSVMLPAESWEPRRRPWVLESHRVFARRRVVEAEGRLAEMRTSAGTAQAGGDANADSSEVDLEMSVAELALEHARAERRSVERRADAMAAKWASIRVSTSGSPAGAPGSGTSMKEDAIRAEGQARVAEARHDVSVKELELLRAEPEKKKRATEKLEKARETLEEVSKSSLEEIKPTDEYTPLAGARWTPTRFLFSGKDDPEVTFPRRSTGRRTALAKWITDRRNPLTARVAVNHIWARHMGKPLVSTVFDFGRNGARPSHPELLDWLAAEFIESDWSMKHLHRLIVTSTAYRMKSSRGVDTDNMARDPDNRYYWRREAVRLESQIVRDSILALTGTLDSTMGGASVSPSGQEASRRRSIYFKHSLTDRNRFLTTFDEAMVAECYRRERSVRPQQALALLNSKLVLESSPKIARRLSESAPDDSVFIRKAFVSVLGCEASSPELTACAAALESWKKLSNDDEARSQLVWTLLNHSDFITVR